MRVDEVKIYRWVNLDGTEFYCRGRIKFAVTEPDSGHLREFEVSKVWFIPEEIPYDSLYRALLEEARAKARSIEEPVA